MVGGAQGCRRLRVTLQLHRRLSPGGRLFTKGNEMNDQRRAAEKRAEWLARTFGRAVVCHDPATGRYEVRREPLVGEVGVLTVVHERA